MQVLQPPPPDWGGISSIHFLSSAQLLHGSKTKAGMLNSFTATSNTRMEAMETKAQSSFKGEVGEGDYIKRTNGADE